MKYLISILIIVLLGCQNYEYKDAFESRFGMQNSRALTEALTNFENVYLQKNYPDLSIEAAYKELLIDYYYENNDSITSTINSLINTINQKKTINQIFGTVDSVWNIGVIGGVHNYSYRIKYVTENDSIFTSIHETSIGTVVIENSPKIDSLMFKRLYKMRPINYHGAYNLALNQIRKRDSFLDNYIDSRNAAHVLSKPIIIKQFVRAKLDLSDYIVRRLIFTDIVL